MCHRTDLRVLAVGAGLLLALGCSETTEKLPCPSKGLGVETASGKLCSSITDPFSPELAECIRQIEDSSKYDCKQPQICPDHGSHRIPNYVLDPKGAGEALSFILTNCSSGEQALTITAVVMAGDDRCSFQFNPAQDITSQQIEAGQSEIIQALYKPLKTGEDHAAFRITSNAQNFPTLVLPLCGKAVPKYPPKLDSGPPPPDQGVPEGGGAYWRCNDVGDKVNKCHLPKLDAGVSTDASKD